MIDYYQACIEKAKTIKGTGDPIPYIKRACRNCNWIFTARSLDEWVCPGCISLWNDGEITLEVL